MMLFRIQSYRAVLLKPKLKRALLIVAVIGVLLWIAFEVVFYYVMNDLYYKHMR